MTREEELYKTADIFSEDHKYEEDLDYVSLKMAFIEGAEWADAHPVDVWHDVSEEPLKDRIFLAELGVSKYGFQTFVLVDNNIEFNWNEWAKEIYLLRWAYISDLLPKGGEK